MILTNEAAQGILPMILQIAKKRRMQTEVVDHEDLVSEGLLALCRSAARFDPKRKVKLSTFAYRHIDGAIRDLQERQENYNKRIETVDCTVIENNVLVDPALESNGIRREQYVNMIRSLETLLPEEQALIIVRHYFEALPLKEIARELDIPISHVERYHTSALNRLRNLLEGR